MRIVNYMIFLGMSLVLSAQTAQERYLEGKSALKASQFESAAAQFSSLTGDQVFGPLATFYFAYSRFREGDVQGAKEAWKQLLLRYPSFDQKEEVYYWLARANFEQSDYQQGIYRGQLIKEAGTRMQLYEAYLDTLDFKELRALFDDYESDRELASVMVRKGWQEKLSQSDRYFIDGIVQRLDINTEDFNEYPVLRRSSYGIGIFLPFLFDGLDKPDRVLRNELVTDIYHGMSLAATMLMEKKLPVELYPYDTQRDSAHTVKLLGNRGIKHLDAMIGPLFPGPFSIVENFAKEKKINIINPVTGNSELLKDNPYAFMMKPDYQTMAKEAANYVAATGEKREAKIYYEDEVMERTIAMEYKSTIEKLGYEVSEFLSIDNKTARQVLAQFSDQEEVVLDIDEEEAEKLLEEGRLIRQRDVYDASGNQVMLEDGSPEIEYYEMVFTADTDSLDHMFAVTRSNLLANNFIGAVESIADTVRLIGLGDWLEFTMLDYKQLERLNVMLIHPDFRNRHTEFYQEVNRLYHESYGVKASLFSLMGFESVWWLGNMLHRHGKYFQNGFYEGEDFESLFYGHRYKKGKSDNQVVPIVQFVDQELKIINSYESSEE